MRSSWKADFTGNGKVIVSDVSYHITGTITAGTCIIRSQFGNYHQPKHYRCPLLYRRQI